MRPAAWMLVCLAACGSGTTALVPPTSPDPVPIGMPGPAPRAVAIDAVALNARCVTCHAQAAAQWKGSMHQRAYTDPVFAEALEIEPLPFCRGCHAPEADPTAPAPTPLAELGVACVSCHVVGGTVLAVDGAPAGPHGRDGVLPLRASKDFGTAAACAGCHEFTFPDSDELMQSTVTEASYGGHPTAPCADCHMPSTGRGRSHAFRDTRDPAVLRAALNVEARLDAGELVISLVPRGVGHAFPTGDLFRRLRVEAELIGPDMNLIERRRRFLTRHFDVRPHHQGPMVGALGRTLRADDRPGGRDHGRRPVQLRWSLAPTESQQLRWQVVYERVAHPAPGGGPAVVASEVLLAEGRFDGAAGRSKRDPTNDDDG